MDKSSRCPACGSREIAWLATARIWTCLRCRRAWSDGGDG
jgi:ribosomal protein L37AE/L43A